MKKTLAEGLVAIRLLIAFATWLVYQLGLRVSLLPRAVVLKIRFAIAYSLALATFLTIQTLRPYGLVYGQSRRGAGQMQGLGTLVFGIFFVVILISYILPPAFSAYSSASTAGWFSNMTGIWGVVGVVVIAILLYGVFKHGVGR